jgi:hypothetical protein
VGVELAYQMFAFGQVQEVAAKYLAVLDGEDALARTWQAPRRQRRSARIFGRLHAAGHPIQNVFVELVILPAHVVVYVLEIEFTVSFDRFA